MNKDFKISAFLHQLDEEGLHTWEKIYQNHLNLSTEDGWTEEELITYKALSRKNLEYIAEAKVKFAK